MKTLEKAKCPVCNNSQMLENPKYFINCPHENLTKNLRSYPKMEDKYQEQIKNRYPVQVINTVIFQISTCNQRNNKINWTMEPQYNIGCKWMARGMLSTKWKTLGLPLTKQWTEKYADVPKCLDKLLGNNMGTLEDPKQYCAQCRTHLGK